MNETFGAYLTERQLSNVLKLVQLRLAHMRQTKARFPRTHQARIKEAVELVKLRKVVRSTLCRAVALRKIGTRGYLCAKSP